MKDFIQNRTKVLGGGVNPFLVCGFRSSGTLRRGGNER